MKKSDIRPIPEYFDRYITLVPNIEMLDAFNKTIVELQMLDTQALHALKRKTYAKNKWTVKEIIQHLSDVERIMNYRTLLASRNDITVPASFDQDFLAQNSKANEQSIEDLIEELITIRLSTVSLFKSFDDVTLRKTFVNWKHEISILGMAFMIIGHQIHHLNIIAKHYMPLIKK